MNMYLDILKRFVSYVMVIFMTVSIALLFLSNREFDKHVINDAAELSSMYGSYLQGYWTEDEILGEIVWAYNAGYLPAGEIEKALNQGAFPGYRNYFISQGIPLSGGSSAAPATATDTVTQSSDTSSSTSPASAVSKATKEEKKESTQEEIDAAWEEVDHIEPSCEDEGKIIYTNSITDETKEESTPALGHDYVETDRVEPMCTEEGSVTYTCSRCDGTYSETLEALGHTPSEAKITEVAATWFNDGYKTTEVYCATCDELLLSETEVYPAIIPVWVRIVVLVGAAVVVAGVIVLLVHRRKKQN